MMLAKSESVMWILGLKSCGGTMSESVHTLLTLSGAAECATFHHARFGALETRGADKSCAFSRLYMFAHARTRTSLCIASQSSRLSRPPDLSESSTCARQGYSVTRNHISKDRFSVPTLLLPPLLRDWLKLTSSADNWFAPIL